MPPTQSLPPALSAVVAEFDDATSRLDALASRLDDNMWFARPPGGGWGAAHCVAHLNITSERFLPLVTDALTRAASEGLTGQDAYRMDFVGRLLLWVLEPPARLRARTPAGFDPRADAPPMRDAIARFHSLQDALKSAVVSSPGLLISRAKLESPFNRRIRYSVYSTFRIIPCHQRRHLWQAERAVGRLEALR